MSGSIYQLVADMERKGEPGVLCTIISSKGATPRHTTTKMIVFPEGRITGTIGGGELEIQVIQEAKQVMKDQKTRLVHYDYNNPSQGGVGVCGGSVEIYLEPIAIRSHILIVGGGHVGKALSFLAHWLGFQVTVIDDRQEFCGEEMAPGADQRICCTMAEIPQKARINEQTYIIFTTRSNELDIEALPHILQLPWSYLGVIGSKRRWELTKKALQEKGLKRSDIEKVHSPIGLELNAETPEEIAVSVMAEIIMLRNAGTGKSMKEGQRRQDVE
jgi:xanthine dehydrogenase accessory factor